MPWPWQKDGLLPLNRRWQTLRARGPKATLRVLIGALILAFVVAIVLSKPIPFVVDTTDYDCYGFGKPTTGHNVARARFRVLTRVSHIRSSAVRACLASAEFLTLEKTQVIAAGTVLWRVAEPRKFFETVFDRTGAESRLGDVLFAELGAAIGRNPNRVRLDRAEDLSSR
jgi:membrane protease subunit HflC